MERIKGKLGTSNWIIPGFFFGELGHPFLFKQVINFLFYFC